MPILNGTVLQNEPVTVISLESSFHPEREITDHRKLFGRKRTLRELEAALLSGTHTEVIGPPKFGKSSLLRCLGHLPGVKGDIVVAYVETGTLCCRQWQDFYRWLMAMVLAAAVSQIAPMRPALAESLDLRNLKLTRLSTDAAKIFAQIGEADLNLVLQGFSRLLRILSRSGIPTILVLDDYSFAVKHFDGDVGRFYFLRQLALHDGPAGSKPLTLCLLDGIEWEEITRREGASSALNFISNHVPLREIHEADARRLLQDHAARCVPSFAFDENTLKAILDLVSTYPYYLKTAGEKAYLQMAFGSGLDKARLYEDTYRAVRGQMIQYLDNADEVEKESLKQLVRSTVCIEASNPVLRRLARRGLLRMEDDRLRAFNQLFRMACQEFI